MEYTNFDCYNLLQQNIGVFFSKSVKYYPQIFAFSIKKRHSTRRFISICHTCRIRLHILLVLPSDTLILASILNVSNFSQYHKPQGHECS